MYTYLAKNGLVNAGSSGFIGSKIDTGEFATEAGGKVVSRSADGQLRLESVLCDAVLLRARRCWLRARKKM
jgi:hypothetical protein